MMFRRAFAQSFVILTVTLIAGSIWAKSPNDTLKTNITINSTAKLADKTLPPGDYRVVVESGQAKFEQGNKVALEVPCTLKTLPAKAQSNTFIMDQDRLTEIQIAGKTEAVDFPAN